jgi:anti-anti-sigma factor
MFVSVWPAAHDAAHLQVSRSTTDGVPVFSFEGELDTWTANSTTWRSAVAEAGAGAPAVVLDLGRLYFMDLVGLASLEELARTLEAGGRRLLLAGARPRIREFLRNASVTITAGWLSLEDALATATTTATLATAA